MKRPFRSHLLNGGTETVAAGGGYNTGPVQLRPDLDQPAGSNMVYVFALPQ